MPYTFSDLGPYLHYSYDPNIVAGTVIGGADRPGGPFATYAAVWTDPAAGGVGWTNLPEGMLAPATACAFDADLTVSIVAGFISFDPTGANPVPSIWNKDRTGAWAFLRIQLPQTADSAIANGISENGEFIAGEANYSTGRIQRGTIWRTDPMVGWAAEDLGTAGGSRAYAVGVSNVGDRVFGNSLLDENVAWRAVEWTSTVGGWLAAPLPLPQLSPGVDASTVSTGINSYKEVAGCAGWIEEIPGGALQAVIWDSSGTPAKIAVSANCEAADTNGTHVVGRDRLSKHAFVWSTGEGVTDLHPPGWQSSEAWAIDAEGTICGIGILGGVAHVLIWKETTMTNIVKADMIVAVDSNNKETIRLSGATSQVEIIGVSYGATVVMKAKDGTDAIVLDAENGNLNLLRGGDLVATGVGGEQTLRWLGSQSSLIVGGGATESIIGVNDTNNKNVISFESVAAKASFRDAAGTVSVEISGQNGTILVKGNPVVTADHVLADPAKLGKLDELEDFIRERSHLPGVPSARAMQAEGIDLVAMNGILLAKVEELTLHIIDQNKRLQALEAAWRKRV